MDITVAQALNLYNTALDKLNDPNAKMYYYHLYSVEFNVDAYKSFVETAHFINTHFDFTYDLNNPEVVATLKKVWTDAGYVSDTLRLCLTLNTPEYVVAFCIIRDWMLNQNQKVKFSSEYGIEGVEEHPVATLLLKFVGTVSVLN